MEKQKNSIHPRLFFNHDNAQIKSIADSKISIHANNKISSLPADGIQPIPSPVFSNLDSISWNNLIGISSGYQPKVRHKSHHVHKLSTEMSFSRILLMEMAREQEKSGALDPKIFVGLVKLHDLSQKMAAQYEVDLHGFNSFLFLLVQKAKKEKLARHEPVAEMTEYTSAEPIIENKFGKYKSVSEKRKRRS